MSLLGLVGVVYDILREIFRGFCGYSRLVGGFGFVKIWLKIYFINFLWINWIVINLFFLIIRYYKKVFRV